MSHAALVGGVEQQPMEARGFSAVQQRCAGGEAFASNTPG